MKRKMLRSVYNITFKGSHVWSLGPQLFDRMSHGELIQPWGIWPKQWVNPPMSSFVVWLEGYGKDGRAGLTLKNCTGPYILGSVLVPGIPLSFPLLLGCSSTFCSSMCQEALPLQSQKWWMKLTISYNLWNWTKLNLFSS